MHNDSLKTTALRTTVIFSVLTGGLVLLTFLYAVRSVILELVVALILSIALYPLLQFFERRRLKRVPAAVATVLVTVVVLLGIIGAIASPLITQGDDLVRSAPGLIDDATSSPVVRNLDNKYHVIDKAKELSSEAPKILGGSSSPVFGVVGSVFSAISALSVVLILVLFMLIEGTTAWSQFTNLLGKDQGKFVDGVARKIIIAVGGFVNGNLFISLIAGIVALVTLLVCHVPYAFALAALVAVFDLIPLVGAVLATVILGIVALTKGVIIAAIVVGVMLTYQFVEGNIIQPIVYGKSVQLSQLLIVIATLIGGLLGGIIGVLLAIPVAAALQIVFVEVLRANGAHLEPTVASSVKK